MDLCLQVHLNSGASGISGSFEKHMEEQAADKDFCFTEGQFPCVCVCMCVCAFHF